MGALEILFIIIIKITVLSSLSNELSPRPDAKPLLKQLHWLPTEQRIKYKIACFCYQIIISTAPQYLAEHFQIYETSRSQRSSWMT